MRLTNVFINFHYSYFYPHFLYAPIFCISRFRIFFFEQIYLRARLEEPLRVATDGFGFKGGLDVLTRNYFHRFQKLLYSRPKNAM